MTGAGHVNDELMDSRQKDHGNDGILDSRPTDRGNDEVGGDHGNGETVRHTRVLLLGFRVGVGPSIYTGFLSKMIAR